MDRIMTVEEKIKRAEEIYARRQGGIQKRTATVNVNNKKKDIKLLKKMTIQIIASLLIYLSVYVIYHNNYIFSEDFINKVNELLSYDMDISQIYENIKNMVQNNINKIKKDQEAIGGAEENITEENIIQENTLTENNEENQNQQEVEKTSQENANEEPLSQEEQDIANIKNTTTFIKPVEGAISSKFGPRDPTTSTVPKNHTGVDIAANIGTKILASTSGEVVLASSEGDYGNHLKIQIGEVSIIYAHCNKMYVKQGEKVEQGQEIAEVGSTGNSTGPHLHFEIRISERIIDPQKILEL